MFSRDLFLINREAVLEMQYQLHDSIDLNLQNDSDLVYIPKVERFINKKNMKKFGKK